MIKGMLVTMAISAAVLKLPNWHPPYSYLENLVIVVATFGVIGPPMSFFFLVLNRLINVSFRFKD